MNIRKQLWILVTLCLMLTGLTAGNQLVREQKALSEKLIRLHVVANSDSQQDQSQKLIVRDAVLREAEAILEAGRAAGLSPRQALSAGLVRIQQAAERTLRGLGSSDPVGVRLGKERFPTRQYETFSLPAGEYESLRVQIGKAAGKNWWCVVFPNLCLAAAGDPWEQAAAAAGLTEDEVRLITEDSQEYVLKFKAIEWVQALRDQIARREEET